MRFFLVYEKHVTNQHINKQNMLLVKTQKLLPAHPLCPMRGG